MVGTCSLVGRMDVTATPAMAEKHIKPNSIGLQSQAEHWYEQEEVPQARSSPPFPLTIRAQPRRVTFLTTTTAFRENRENDRQMGSLCLDKPVLAQRGRGSCPRRHEQLAVEGNKRTARTAHSTARAPRARFWVAVLRTSG